MPTPELVTRPEDGVYRWLRLELYIPLLVQGWSYPPKHMGDVDTAT